jgi:molybdenum cofactor cytidylyltransferase
MKFGPLPVTEAVGGIVAHTVRQRDFTLKKGVSITPEHVRELQLRSISEIVVAMLEPSDISENEAAGRLAQTFASSDITVDRPFAGRSNLFSTGHGLLHVDREKIDAANSIDEAITIATLQPMKHVIPGEMLATVKIIPFAVDVELVERASRLLYQSIRLLPFRDLKVGVISTLLPGLKLGIVDKTVKVMAERLDKIGRGKLICDLRVPHDQGAICQALREARGQECDLAIVFGASAITDRRDVIPAAIMASGGRIEHLGMPVDPGNLLLIGEAEHMTVIGAPGCARSPKENGFDWVLQRLLAGVPVRKSDIQAMGTGGLLMEIFSRPQPRLPETMSGEVTRFPSVTAIVMAAGRSTRMGSNKLLERFEGKPLVRHVVEAALASPLDAVLVVTGHQSAEIRLALADLNVSFVDNPDFANGMSTSLKAGIAAVAPGSAGALVLLGDMPCVTSGVIEQLIEAFASAPETQAVVPVAGGKRGNPVLISRDMFGRIAALSGDTGARALLGEDTSVVELQVNDAAVLNDIDTPEALAVLRAG